MEARMEDEAILRLRTRVLEVMAVCGGKFRWKRFTELEREEICRVHRASGMTAAAFAEAVGLSINQFRNFQNKPKHKNPSHLLPVNVTSSPRAEVRYEVVSPSGYRTFAFSARAAAELLLAIEGAR
jgi:hypothetical protein